MTNSRYPGLKERVWVLGLNCVIAYVAFIVDSGRILPTGGLESVWLLSAAALWFLSLLSAPWFLPPRDGLVNAIGAMLVLVTLDLTAVSQFRDQLEVTRWVFVAYSAMVLVIALVALFFHDNDPQAPRTKAAYRLNAIFGAGELLYSPPVFVSIFGAYQDSLPTMASLSMLWIAFVVARPVQKLFAAAREYSGAKAVATLNSVVGNIARIDDPNIVRVRMTSSSSWTPGTLNVAAMPGGKQHYVLALFTQTQGIEVIGTGLCVAVLAEPIPLISGEVCLSHDQDKAAAFLETMSGTPGAELVGFTVEGSTIGTLRFEVALSRSLQEGEVVYARIEGRDVFYQILDAETSEESFDQNPRGTHIVRAAQLGCYSNQSGFTKFAWLPTMNTPLFSGKTRKFDTPMMGEREFIVGKVPSSGISVVANVDELVEYHAAILGVTGTGKTELALDIVREAVARGVKAFCVDFTGDYSHRLADLNPEFLSPTKGESDALEANLFAVETGKFGAPDEKKALKAEVDKLRVSTAAQIDAFLSGDKKLAIFELPEITNTKATLRLTELYLSTIMSWAKTNRGARQVMIVLEEAHTIVPETSFSGFDNDTQWVVGRVGQIALQGRKYGVGLVVVSQRTALVSKTILSQCNTFFTHSLVDQTSLNFLENVYSSQHARLIPNLPTFHFLAFGKAVRAERPILIGRDFDPKRKEASKRIPPRPTAAAAPVMPEAFSDVHSAAAPSVRTFD